MWKARCSNSLCKRSAPSYIAKGIDRDDLILAFKNHMLNSTAACHMSEDQATKEAAAENYEEWIEEQYKVTEEELQKWEDEGKISARERHRNRDRDRRSTSNPSKRARSDSAISNISEPPPPRAESSHRERRRPRSPQPPRAKKMHAPIVT